MKYLLYNPLSGSGKSRVDAECYDALCDEKCKLVDMTDIANLADFFEILDHTDEIYIFGGDGTLNKFVNGIGNTAPKNKIYYYPSGTGNDFSLDTGHVDIKTPFLINDYIVDLPSVTVKGQTYKFINGVGYGIDGYCCEVGDELKALHKLPNYTSIAIKGLLFYYKPTGATVTVDGKCEHYKKVWIAPTMHGSHYGGGMIPTPNQKREDKSNLSLMLFHSSGKLRTLSIFPSIFKGTHTKHKKYVTVLTGKEITVRFDRPTALQIDGETILGVEEYTARVSECALV